MLDAEEAVELRALQARAYGREGALTTEESRRLAELNAKRAEAPSEVERVRPESDETPREEAVALRGDQGRTASTALGATSAPAPPPASARRPRWPLIAAALLIVFALGATAGWVLTRPSEHEVDLTPAQAAWQQELIDGGEYDAGSIRAMAVEDGMVVWAATQSRGLTTCLVLGDAEERVPSCISTEIVRSSGFDTVRTVDVDGELKRQVSAQVFLTPDNAPAVVVGSFLFAPPDEFGASYGSDEEEAFAEALVEHGLERTSIWIVGYDGETPIWTGIKTSTGQTCVAYDSSDPEPFLFCEEFASAGSAAQRGLGFDHVDPETGDSSFIQFTFGDGPSYLQITREHASGDAE
ncbi:hypothetical protein ACIQTT_06320 [Microbacterium sp. NPDC090225]|uniref:hypothetical protein n=1 Tax=Microbacterium sp. NPDC090225 TaxID=3364207 RepID=UPI003823E213